MTKMKIAIDARMVHHTGIGRYISEILRFIDANADNLPFEVVVFSNTPIGYKRLEEQIVHSRVFSIQEQGEIPLALRRNNIQLLHSTQFNIPILSRIKQIVTIHDCAFDKLPEEALSFMAKMYYRFMMKQIVRKATKIITASESIKKDLMKYYKLPDWKVKVIYHGIDFAKFYSFNSKDKITHTLAKYALNTDFGLYVGLTRPRKNIMNILLAIKILKERGIKDFKFVFAGKTDTRFYNISNISKKLGIDDIVVQTGYIEEELLALYKKATFLSFPSIYEGFGLPVLEAMAAGIPVITSNVSSLPEVAGDAALLVNPYDINEIADAMLRVLEDQNLRKELIKKGNERINEFSWDKCVKETLKVYEDVGFS